MRDLFPSWRGPEAAELERWLRAAAPDERESLWRLADETRARHVGDEVHLRGLIEISNHCRRACAYCGLRAPNAAVVRYRMERDEILAAARLAAGFGYGTVVLQSGEDPGLTGEWVADLIGRIRGETGLAITLSLGERDDDELARWRAAGADRYLLRFETSNRALYERIHPSPDGAPSDRPARLLRLRALGYEIGGGVMVGLPGQNYGDLARDLLLFRALDLDMIGVGPYLPHPATPLARAARLPEGEQAPGTEEMACRMVALARMVCPRANIPSTTALAVADPACGRVNGLARGANVVMPNVTPERYRRLYEIYPGKTETLLSAEDNDRLIKEQIRALGRRVGMGPGGATRPATDSTDRKEGLA